MKKIILLSILGLLLSFCKSPKQTQLIPTYNHGGYTLGKISKNSLFETGEIVINGYVKEHKDLRKISLGNITITCSSIPIDTSGYYYIKGKIGDFPISMTCLSIGYRTIETEPINLERGDSLRVDFFLAVDDRPLINCEGK